LIISRLLGASVITMTLALLCSCANQSVNRSQTREASTHDSGAQIKSYTIRMHYQGYDKGLLPVRDTSESTLTVDLKNNQLLLWNYIPLQLVNISEQAQGQKLYITGQSPDGNNAVGLKLVVPWYGHTLIQLYETDRNTYSDFFHFFNQLKFPDDYHGLIASTKCLDGTPLEIAYEYAASIQLTNQRCLLNGKMASFHRSTMSDGKGVVVVQNGESKLILWPDGNWNFSNTAQSGTQLGGFDSSLKQMYLDLRIQSQDASTDSSNTTATGFFISDDGYLITNYHVVKGANRVRLLTGTGLIDATVVKVDAANDLALVKATGTFSPLPVSMSKGVKLGATVATVGFPDIGLQGFSPKLSKGEIGSLAGVHDDPRYFQISVAVQPGNSGGALVDAHGNVVGIVAAKLNPSVALTATGAMPENVNYAVKSSLLLSFLESVPDVSAKIKEPNTKDEPFEDVVKSAQDAAVLVLAY